MLNPQIDIKEILLKQWHNELTEFIISTISKEYETSRTRIIKGRNRNDKDAKILLAYCLKQFTQNRGKQIAEHVGRTEVMVYSYINKIKTLLLLEKNSIFHKQYEDEINKANKIIELIVNFKMQRITTNEKQQRN